MVSNLNKGYSDIDEPGTRKPAQLRKRTTTTTTTTDEEKEPLTKKTPAKVAAREPKKITGKKRYERLEEKSTPSHDIGESKTEIILEHGKLKGDLDRSDRRYYALKDRLIADEAKGTVPKGSAAKFAQEMIQWQENAKNEFRGWVDQTVEKNRVNKKAAGTFNNMLDDAEEALTDLDSRPGPESYFQTKSLERAQAIKRQKQLDEIELEKANKETNVVSDLGGLLGPEGGAVGPDGQPMFTPEQLAASKDKTGYNKTASNVRSMFEGMIDAAAKKSNMSQEQVYRLKKDLDKKLEVVDLEAQMATSERVLQAKPEKDEGAWGFIKGVAGDALGAAVDVGSRGLDLISRPGYAAANAFEAARGNVGDIGKIAGAAVEGIEGSEKNTFSDIVRKAYVANGRRDLDTWFENAAVGGVGFIADVATDPFTYTTFGTSTLGKKAALEAAERLGASKRVVKTLVEETFPSVRAARRSDQVFETATKVAKFEEKISKAPDVVKAANKMKQDEVKRLFQQGVTVSAAEKQLIFDRAISTVTKADGAVYEAAMLSGQKPRLAVKFVGKDIGDIPAVGRALEKAHVPFSVVGKAYKSTSFGRAMSEMFTMRAHFPGYLDRLRRIVEGNGLLKHQKFQEDVNAFLKGFSKEDRLMISQALESGQDLTGHIGKNGKDLGDAQKEARRLSDVMWDEKVAEGISNPNDKALDYVFHYYRGDAGIGPKQMKQFKADRKSVLRRKAKGPTLAEAAAAKMKPYQDIGDILKLQHADHQRKLSRVLTNSSFVEQYGLMTDNLALARANKLVDITHKLPKNIQTIATKQGKRYYIHQDISRVFEHLDKLHSLDNAEEMTHLMQFFTRTTNWWKSTATIYNPGNWINNSMGDLALNYFDGVQNPKWYKKAYEVVIRGKKNGNKVIMRLGGKDITQKEAWELYENFAGGAGFLRAEVDEVVGRFAPGVRHKIHAAYQHREDFSRFAHFIYSLEDEFKRVPLRNEFGKIPRAVSKRIEDAALAASDRVAKFNIDYSAFTPFERKLKGGAVPFYSWMRKAFPLMLENMVQRPGRYTALEKGMKALERGIGVAPDYEGNYNVHIPDWLQQSGILRLSGGPNPTVIKNPLPSNIIPGVLGEGTLEGSARNFLSMLHPAAQVPMEMLTGEKLFSGNRIDSPEAYIMDKFPMFRPIAAVSPFTLPGQKDKTIQQRIGILAGSTPWKVDQKMQAGELRRQQDSQQAQVRQLNQEIYPIQITKTAKGWKVSNDENGRTWDKTFADPKDAYMVALQLKKQDGSPPGSGG